MSAWVAAALGALAMLVALPAPASVAGPPLRRWHVSVRPRRGRAAEADRAAVLEVCDLMVSELGAGRPPGAALRAAAERWPVLQPVVEADGLGADVPAALHRIASARPGAADLRWVAGAWQVAHDTGHGLAVALDRTADGLRARRRTRRLVDSELASARATARLVACLPVAVLLMGSGTGSDPWSFLLLTPVGWVCMAIGLGLLALGLWWIERLAGRAATT